MLLDRFDSIGLVEDNINGGKDMKLILKRIGFYALSFTWGIIPSLIGGLIILTLLPFGKVRTFHGRVYAVVGNNWGGLEFGCFFLICKTCANNDYLRAHEMGHGLQNCLWGPLGIFVINIPSAIRYWYRELKYERKGLTPPTGYYDIWFEKQASDWGLKYVMTDLM